MASHLLDGPAQPARPVLAITLYHAVLAARASEESGSSSPHQPAGVDGDGTADSRMGDVQSDEKRGEKRKRTLCRTGFDGIDDEALVGGFPYGRGGVVGVASQLSRVGLSVSLLVLRAECFCHSLQKQERMCDSVVFVHEG